LSKIGGIHPKQTEGDRQVSQLPARIRFQATRPSAACGI
jgi:hypothetical protein